MLIRCFNFIISKINKINFLMKKKTKSDLLLADYKSKLTFTFLRISTYRILICLRNKLYIFRLAQFFQFVLKMIFFFCFVHCIGIWSFLEYSIDYNFDDKNCAAIISQRKRKKKKHFWHLCRFWLREKENK